jgi:quercetin dioxygenase-like cupin family protein
MEIKKSGSQPPQRAPGEHFTGTARIDPLFQSSPPGRAGGAYVTFEPRSELAYPSARSYRAMDERRAVKALLRP